MSGFIEGSCRTQATLFPDRLDDYLSEENEIRVIDAFIDSLALDSANNRVLVVDTRLQAVIAVDLVDGARVILSR